MINGIDLRPQLIPGIARNNFKCIYARSGLYEPYEYYTSWVSEGTGYLGVANVAVPNAISILNKIQNVLDISFCFDGSWVSDGYGYLFVTSGEPVVAYIDIDGNLYADGLLVSTDNYLYVDAIRGWKSLVDEEDIGLLIVAANNETVNVYKKVVNDKSIAYDLISTITNYSGIKDIRTSLLADFRLSISIITEDKTYTITTERLYIGGAVIPEQYKLPDIELGEPSITAINIAKTEFDNIEGIAYIPRINTIDSSFNAYIVKQPTEIYAYNQLDNVIFIHFNTDIVVDASIINELSIVSEYGVPVIINSYEYGRNYIKFNCSKFNNYLGEFLITLKNNGSLKLHDDSYITNFKISFVPVGLIPDDVEPPKVIELINMEVEDGL